MIEAFYKFSIWIVFISCLVCKISNADSGWSNTNLDRYQLIDLDPEKSQHSSTYNSGNLHAPRAVTGDCRSLPGNFSKTEVEEKPFWYINLGGRYSVGHIQLGMAMDESEAVKFSEAYVMVTDNRPDMNSRMVKGLCAFYRGPAGYGEVLNFNCSHSGEYVMVMLNKKESLILCDVKIFADNQKAISPPNMEGDLEVVHLDPSKAVQSSTYTSSPEGHIFYANKAVNGDCRYTWWFVSATKQEEKPYWYIDLKEEYQLALVQLGTVMHQNALRMKQLYVMVTSEPPDFSYRSIKDVCAYFQGPAREGEVIRLKCEKYGRYLVVMMMQMNHLELCNVMVYKVSGTWADWGEWSLCNKNCGPGQRVRTRKCYHQKVLSNKCLGQSMETQPCNLNQCSAVWSPWSPWSDCSTSCDTGLKIRNRDCLRQNNQSVSCSGSHKESTSCKLRNCPNNVITNSAVKCWICEDCPTEWSKSVGSKDGVSLESGCEYCVKETFINGKVRKSCSQKSSQYETPGASMSAVHFCRDPSESCNKAISVIHVSTVLTMLMTALCSLCS